MSDRRSGVLVVDKPEGLTSHDVVALARRHLGERRIGHTGTLDPLATGVLPLACGKATRLVRFLAASDKDYDATIRFGLATDSYDITGRETARSVVRPSKADVERAVAALGGEQLQTPPAYSAKKLEGRRAYALARDGAPAALAPVPVRLLFAELVDFDGDTARVTLTTSAGFYVRSFAHELGARVGVPACLAALRRTRSGDFTLASAVTVEALTTDLSVLPRLVPLSHLLPGLPAACLTPEGQARAVQGQDVRAQHFVEGAPPPQAWLWLRLIGEHGELLAMASPGRDPGAWHPSIVLG